jgi:osmotically-inducible protein OsmY
MSVTAVRQPSVADLLGQSAQPLLRRLRVEENEKEVVLEGKVPTYFLKQLAQETVRPCLGSRKLLNRIVVDN